MSYYNQLVNWFNLAGFSFTEYLLWEFSRSWYFKYNVCTAILVSPLYSAKSSIFLYLICAYVETNIQYAVNVTPAWELKQVTGRKLLFLFRESFRFDFVVELKVLYCYRDEMMFCVEMCTCVVCTRYTRWHIIKETAFCIRDVFKSFLL